MGASLRSTRPVAKAVLLNNRAERRRVAISAPSASALNFAQTTLGATIGVALARMSARRVRNPSCFSGLVYHCGFPQIKHRLPTDSEPILLPCPGCPGMWGYVASVDNL